MRYDKDLRQLITCCIKNGGAPVILADIKTFLQSMEPKDIQIFWNSYSSELAMEHANRNVDEWRTKEQIIYFKAESSSLAYWPKKDSNGKYIYEKNEIIDHVVFSLTKYINNEVARNNILKNRTFLERAPAYLLISNILTIPVLLVSLFFFTGEVTRMIVIGVIVYYNLSQFLLYPTLLYFIKRGKKIK